MKTKNLMTISATILMVFLSMVYSIGQTTTAPTQPSTANPDSVGVNSTHTYDVAYTTRNAGAAPNTYVWTISEANASFSITGAGVPGTDYTIAAGADAALQNIVWLKAGYYVIQLQENNPAGYGSCAGTPQTLDVCVGPTGTVQFASATGINQCSAAGSYSTTLSFSGTISYPVTVNVKYTINGSTSTATISIASAVSPLVIPAGVNFLTSLNDDPGRSVQITGAQDSFGGALALGATNTNTLTIWSLPATTPIHHN
jgi:hypothetical protein